MGVEVSFEDPTRFFLVVLVIGVLVAAVIGAIREGRRDRRHERDLDKRIRGRW